MTYPVGVDNEAVVGNIGGMKQFGGQGNHRVFVPQALGADEFLRVTWHEHNGVFVFSHWNGEECVAATPVRIEDMGEMASLVVTALGHSVARTAAAWGPPSADEIVSLAQPA